MPAQIAPIEAPAPASALSSNKAFGSGRWDDRAPAPAGEAIRRRAVREELAESYGRYRSIALRQLRDPDAADDVVQAFALKALDRAAQLRDANAVHGWLRRLFETTLIDFCRRRSTCRQREVAFELDQHDRADPTLADQGPDPARTLLATLTHLKAEYADVIYRLDLLDQPRQAVADQFGITVNNLTVRAHRARRALRQALEAAPVSGIAVRSGASRDFALAF